MKTHLQECFKLYLEHNWNGYLEDRRPASNADPYKILAHIVGTLTK